VRRDGMRSLRDSLLTSTLLFLYAFAVLLDIAITRFALENRLAYELNPIFNVIRVGEPLFWGLKGTGIGIVFVGFFSTFRSSPSTAYRWIVVCWLIIILVVFWNLYNVVLSLHVLEGKGILDYILRWKP
jgi:hypothetical protein